MYKDNEVVKPEDLEVLFKYNFFLMIEKVNWGEIYEFFKSHRVEINFGNDLQYYCFIDYMENDRAFAVDLDPLSAMLNGIANYINANKAETDETI